MKKGLIYGGGAVVLIVVIAVVVVLLRAGDVIKAVVEELGPQMTKSEVTLANVDLSLRSGEADLSGLLIGNPASFQTPHVFKLDNISVKIDTGSIGEDTIVINEISIDSPDVIAEFGKFSFNPLKSSESIQQSLQTSNFIAIQKNVDAFVKEKTGGGDGKPAAAKDDEGKEGPKLIIEKFRMNNVKVRAVSQDGLKLDTSLPPFSISLDNIGKKENGLPPEAIAAVLIPEVQKAVTSAISDDLIKTATDLVGKLGDTAKEGIKAVTEGAGDVGKKLSEGAGDIGKKLTEGAGDIGKKLTEGGGDVGKSVTGGAKGATDAIKGIFGK
jgi:hypothetical protein